MSTPAPPGRVARTGLLGLGSNVGDRRGHLQGAVLALPGAGVEVLACSSVYDTDPVGEVLDQPSFLNACVLVRTDLEALELLTRREGPRAGARPQRTDRATGRARSTSTSCCWVSWSSTTS